MLVLWCENVGDKQVDAIRLEFGCKRGFIHKWEEKQGSRRSGVLVKREAGTPKKIS